MVKNIKDNDSFKERFFDIFVGGRSIFSVMIAVVGAILVGNTLFEFLFAFMGSYYTFLLGVLMLMLGGFYIGFYKG